MRGVHTLCGTGTDVGNGDRHAWRLCSSLCRGGKGEIYRTMELNIDDISVVLELTLSVYY